MISLHRSTISHFTGGHIACSPPNLHSTGRLSLLFPVSSLCLSGTYSDRTPHSKSPNWSDCSGTTMKSVHSRARMQTATQEPIFDLYLQQSRCSIVYHLLTSCTLYHCHASSLVGSVVHSRSSRIKAIRFRDTACCTFQPSLNRPHLPTSHRHRNKHKTSDLRQCGEAECINAGSIVLRVLL